MSQRGIEVVIAGRGAGTLDVEPPPSPNHAPLAGIYSLSLIQTGFRLWDDGYGLPHKCPITS